MSLPFSRFLGLQTLAAEARREEVKEKFTIAAFIGWQMGARIKVAGEPEDASNTFQDHLVKLGLADGEKSVLTETEPTPASVKGKPSAASTAHNQEMEYQMLRAMGGKVKINKE